MGHEALYLSLLFVSGYVAYLRLLFWACDTLSVRGTEMPARSSPRDVRTASQRSPPLLGDVRTDDYTPPIVAPTTTRKVR